MMFNIYLLPGMGSDKRIFSNLSMPAHHIHYLSWPDPGSCKDIIDYARMLANQIKTQNNLLIGVSMGGIVAVEMAKIIHPVSVILISAPARSSEFTPMLKAFRATNPQRFLPHYLLLNPGFFSGAAMQFQSKEGKILFTEMLRDTEINYLKFAMRAVFRWRNEELPKRFIQLVGTRDRLFNPNKMKDPIKLRGAGHFAVFESPREISTVINEYTDSLGK